MSKRLLEQSAAIQAEAVIADMGITSLPVNPFVIAKKAEIEVLPKPSDAPGVSGFLMREGDQFGICFATHIKNQGFINFTVSHELGHYYLPGHPAALFPNGRGIHQSRSGFISDDPFEMEADYFASSLLMPESLFVRAIAEVPAGFAGIETLADRCGTSITATAIRYAGLAEHPVAVVVSSGNTVSYCFMSPQFQSLLPRGQWISKGHRIYSETATAKFNADPTNITSGRQRSAWSSLDMWVDGARELELKEDVVGLGSYGRTLTVLFNDEVPDADDDDSENEDD